MVCRDIPHAKEIYELINSEGFYDGQYKGKVLQIDSSTKKEEDIEKQFLSLESPDNEIEIVIHVNMLKEGWDVTNLYTIVPLRAANAGVLVEQTIGRGLRLPYDGKRTGEDKIDKLTVVAHENFNAVIEAAQNPNSILNKMSFVEIPEEDLSNKTQVVTSKPITEQNFEKEQEKVNTITNTEQKQKAQNTLDAKKAIINVLPDFSSLPEVRRVEDLNKEEVKRKVIRQVEQDLSKGQQNLFKEQILQEAKTGTRDLNQLNGLMNPVRGLPLTSGLLVLAGMASAGIPGLVGFAAEILVFQGSFAVFPIPTIICILSSGLTAVYFVILINRTCFGRLDNKLAYYDGVTWRDQFPALALTIAIFFPIPSINPVLVTKPRALARRRTSRLRSYLACTRTGFCNRFTVSMLWFRISGSASSTVFRLSSLPTNHNTNKYNYTNK